MKRKCTLLINNSLPAGLAMNAAVILGLSAGRRLDSFIGFEVPDASGFFHTGVIELPIAVLSASAELLSSVMAQKAAGRLEDLIVLDFSRLAQSCPTYDDYQSRIAAANTADLEYSGLLLFGSDRTIRHLTGSLPLWPAA